MSSTTGACEVCGGGGVASPSSVEVTVFPNNTESQAGQVLVSLPETGMVNAMGHYQMPLDLQGHSNHLVV